ncbi:MAG: IS3 family transposase [Limisphaerales bacterium]
MKRLRVSYTLRELCDALDVSRSGYLAWKDRPPSARHLSNAQLLNQMRIIHAHRHTRCYGSPRMTWELRAKGWSCSENRVARLMRKNRLRARPRRPFRPKTTAPDHAAAPSPNVLAGAGAAQAPAQHLVSDITYIPTAQGWLYLAVVIDRFTRMVLGWKLSDSLHCDLVTAALDKALATRLVAPGALFHSDRGCQYSAGPFRKRLAQATLLQSMSAKGCCYDNALAESFFASFKNEALPDDGRFENHRTASRAVFDYIECFYNRRRRHTALGGLSPLTFLNRFFQNKQPSLN